MVLRREAEKVARGPAEQNAQKEYYLTDVSRRGGGQGEGEFGCARRGLGNPGREQQAQLPNSSASSSAASPPH